MDTGRNSCRHSDHHRDLDRVPHSIEPGQVRLDGFQGCVQRGARLRVTGPAGRGPPLEVCLPGRRRLRSSSPLAPRLSPHKGLGVVTALEPAYRRADGVQVVPITALGP